MISFTDTERRWLKDQGVSKQLLFHWERGGGISTRFLPIVAKVKGITIDELVNALLTATPSREEPPQDAQGVAK